MALPTLDDLTPALDRIGVDLLGDTIEYAADGSTFVEVQAFVNYRDVEVDLSGAEKIAQDMTVSGLLKADVATKPPGTARVRLARRAGKSYRPINVRTDEGGTGWEFEVKEVAGG